MSPLENQADSPAIKRTLKKEALKAFFDSFTNLATNLGTSRDKAQWGEFDRNHLLTPDECETLFQDNDLAHKIVAKPVNDALRGGFTIKRARGGSDADREEADEILKTYAKVCRGPKETSKVQRAAWWGRLFGGGGLVLGVKGSGRPNTPLDDEKVKEIVLLSDFDRQDMTPTTWYPDGSVETYRWAPPATGTAPMRNVLVHESRVLVFPGAPTTNRTRARNQQWDLSVLQRVYEVLKSFSGMYGSVDNMFADASQAVFKLQGLIQALAEADDGADGSTGASDVQTRLQLLDFLRSSLRAIMLDAGDADGNGAESFEVIERNIGQLADTMTQYFTRLAAAADMPLTVLLGTSPAGMDATGESDMILYFNTVDVYRQSLTPIITRLIHMIARTLGDSDPESWEIEWPELARPKPLDVATATKMNIDSAVALVGAGIVLPEEVALSLSRLAPTLGLIIDAPSRQKALKDALKELEDREMTGVNAQPEEEPGGVKPAAKASERKTPSKAAGRQV